MTLEDRIGNEIRANGPLSFSQYMELALYEPTDGFYASGGGAGRQRDFLTSPEVGPLFGRVVSQALDVWWKELGRPDPFFVLEGGAGPGALARGVLRAKPQCASALRYVLIDRAPGQRAHHADHLELTAPDVVLDPAPLQDGPLICSLPELPTVDGVGVVLANELMDNLPFDLLRYHPDHGWEEVLVDLGVGFLTEKFVATDRSFSIPVRAGDEGQEARIPVQAQAQKWLRTALTSLRAGRVVVFDYMVEKYPVGQRQWLRTYKAHHHGSSPLHDPGLQDITADVALDQLAAVKAPLITRTQAVWLRHFGITALVQEGRDYWQAHAVNPDLLAMQFRSRIGESEALLDGSGLGAFRVAEWDI